MKLLHRFHSLAPLLIIMTISACGQGVDDALSGYDTKILAEVETPELLTYIVSPTTSSSIYTGSPIIFNFSENMDTTKQLSITGSMATQINSVAWKGTLVNTNDILIIKPKSSWPLGFENTLSITVFDLVGNTVTTDQLAYTVLKTQALNDTGITLCGDVSLDSSNSGTRPGFEPPSPNDGTNNDINCASVGATATVAGREIDNKLNLVPAGQDAHYGHDATENDDADGLAGFSFIKLDRFGIALSDQSVSYPTTPWSCVQDNITGLMWEVKTDSNDLQNKNLTFSWFNSTGKNDGGDAGVRKCNSTSSVCDTEAFITAINTLKLCGYNDWRLPSVTELSSLLNYSGASLTIGNTFIDKGFFPNTLEYLSTPESVSYYWTSTSDAEFSYKAWIVNFGRFYSPNGRLFYKESAHSVRLVREGQ